MLGELALSERHRPAAPVENQRARARSTLVERKDVVVHRSGTAVCARRNEKAPGLPGLFLGWKSI